MDRHFFDDCGLEGHDHLHFELGEVRREYSISPQKVLEMESR